MQTNSKAVTIRDVATKAGVSVTTVSRVLNGKDDISEATTQKVLAVIEELGYASSLAARGMRAGRPGAVRRAGPRRGADRHRVRGAGWRGAERDHDRQRSA